MQGGRGQPAGPAERGCKLSSSFPGAALLPAERDALRLSAASSSGSTRWKRRRWRRRVRRSPIGCPSRRRARATGHDQTHAAPRAFCGVSLPPRLVPCRGGRSLPGAAAGAVATTRTPTPLAPRSGCAFRRLTSTRTSPTCRCRRRLLRRALVRRRPSRRFAQSRRRRQHVFNGHVVTLNAGEVFRHLDQLQAATPSTSIRPLTGWTGWSSKRSRWTRATTPFWTTR